MILRRRSSIPVHPETAEIFHPQSFPLPPAAFSLLDHANARLCGVGCNLRVHEAVRAHHPAIGSEGKHRVQVMLVQQMAWTGPHE